MRSHLIGAVLATVLAVPSATFAHGYGPAMPISKVTIDVHARIAGRCGFSNAPESSTKALDVNVAQTLAIPFKLDCNTPFVIGVKSDNGALASHMTPDNSGFAFTKPYKVALDIGTDGSSLKPNACDSEALTVSGEAGLSCAFYGAKPGQGLSSDKAISPNKPSQLTVSWVGARNGASRNVAGAYRDTLTITVAPRT